MLSINENLFSKQMVKTFFDLRIKVKYNILRLKNLEYYIGKEKAKRYLLELEEFEKDIKEYMQIYNERFQRTAVKNNLKESEEKNEELIKKYKKESQEIKNFENKNNFPTGTYSLEINLFVEDFVEDILKLENIKKIKKKVLLIHYKKFT